VLGVATETPRTDVCVGTYIVSRLAHFITHPIQYFAPLYRQLAAAGNVELKVLFGSDFGIQPSFDEGFGETIQYDVPLLDGYAHEFLRNRGAGIPSGDFANFDCPDVWRVLRDGNFDAVWIHGWGYRAHWQVIRAARRLGLPYLVRAETHDGTRSVNRWRAIVRKLLVGRGLRSAAACLYVGKRNREFYRSMGVAEDRLFPAHYSVDARRFDQCRPCAEDRDTLRGELGARPGEFVLVTAAKAIPRKRIEDAIRAVSECRPDVHLWIVGEGPDRARLEGLGETLAPGRTHWLGFVNQSNMPGVLSLADAFVLASDDEPWGLVVNEAMACALPVLVSDRVGSAADLVHDGATGYTYPARDVGALADRIGRLLSDREAAIRMGRNGQELVLRDYDVRTTARQIADAIQAILGPRTTRG